MATMQKMTRRTDDILAAFLDDDIPRLTRLVAGPGAIHTPQATQARALAIAQASLAGERADDAAFTTVTRAIQQRDDSDLYRALLASAMPVLLNANRMGDAERIDQLLADLIPKTTRPALRARMLIARHLLLSSRLGWRGEMVLLDQAARLDLPAGTPTWLAVRLARAHMQVSVRRHNQATRELDEAAEHCPRDDRIAFLRAFICMWTGRPEDGLAALDRAVPSNPARAGWTLHLRVELLLAARRFKDARRLLDEMAVRPPAIPRSARFALLAEDALARRDMAAARAYCHDGLADMDVIHPCGSEGLIRLLAQVELADGRAQAASRLLGKIDPNESTAGFEMAWARLYRLTGNDERAAHHFRRLLDLGVPEVIEGELRWAWELSAAALARLWRTAERVRQPAATASAEVRDRPAAPPAKVELIGSSPALRDIRMRIAQYARLDAPVLITGETGTGKEVVARLLHQASPRSARPFLAINCGALAENLIESELFGHVRGSFTGAVRDHEGLLIAAGGGTVLLDEINSMPPRLQAVMLRVLETGEVRPVGSSRVSKVAARIVAATNQPLDQAVGSKQFRMDLYYRLARLHIDIPPLRQRPEDITDLVRFFLRQLYGEFEVAVAGDLIEALCSQPWPGNVRQLRHEIERLVLLAGEAKVLDAALLGSVRRPTEPMPYRPADAPPTAGPISAGRGGLLPQFPEIRQTFRRRQKLRELFEQYPQLTRADVIAIFGCAPNTAAADLKSLLTDGSIRRVDTSANARTSYFVRNVPAP